MFTIQQALICSYRNRFLFSFSFHFLSLKSGVGLNGNPIWTRDPKFCRWRSGSSLTSLLEKSQLRRRRGYNTTRAFTVKGVSSYGTKVWLLFHLSIMNAQRLLSFSEILLEQMQTQCLKITKKVAFYMASEASYVYILS